MPLTIIVAPDSFKGTLTAVQAAQALAAGLQRSLPTALILQYPLADGGEGTLDALVGPLSAERYEYVVTGAAQQPVKAAMGIAQVNGQVTALIEAAQVVGITDATAIATPVMARTTRGLGELILKALDHGAEQVIIGLGGSCTNDGGAGLLAALGVWLLDAQLQPILPTPTGLQSLETVDASALDPRLQTVQFVTLADVNNPLCGPQGATAVFGPQKGLRDPATQQAVDRALNQYADLVEQAVPRSNSAPGSLKLRPGAGAAGGLGFALSVLGSTTTSGAQFIAQQIGLPDVLKTADWLITGEGQSDRQTLSGKVPWVVAQLAQAEQVPVMLLSGNIAPDAGSALSEAFPESCLCLAPGPHCCFPPDNAPASTADCCQRADYWLQVAGQQLGQTLLAV